MEQPRFFRCSHCGNLVGMIEASGVPIICCGEPMKELTANTFDAAQEKHVPVIEQNGGTVLVKVGSVAHPMGADHKIDWIYLLTEQGGQRKTLTVDAAPQASFSIAPEDRVIAAYAYCNLHSLWMAKA